MGVEEIGSSTCVGTLEGNEAGEERVVIVVRLSAQELNEEIELYDLTEFERPTGSVIERNWISRLMSSSWGSYSSPLDESCPCYSSAQTSVSRIETGLVLSAELNC